MSLFISYINKYKKNIFNLKLMTELDIQAQELVIQAALELLKLNRIGREDDYDFIRNKKTDFQNTVLKEVFKLTMYPSAQTKTDISILLDLSVRTIQIWFQNERRIRKNEVKKTNLDKFEVSALILWRIYTNAKYTL